MHEVGLARRWLTLGCGFPALKVEDHVDIRRAVRIPGRQRCVTKADVFVESQRAPQATAREENDLASTAVTREGQAAIHQLPADALSTRARGDRQLHQLEDAITGWHNRARSKDGRTVECHKDLSSAPDDLSLGVSKRGFVGRFKEAMSDQPGTIQRVERSCVLGPKCFDGHPWQRAVLHETNSCTVFQKIRSRSSPARNTLQMGPPLEGPAGWALIRSLITIEHMDVNEAADLIAGAVGDRPGHWADLGAGSGTFTLALLHLLPGTRVHAVDRDSAAVEALSRLGPDVIALRADFAAPAGLSALAGVQFDGVILANSLHFVDDAASVLRRLVSVVRPGGRVVIVEYDRRAASRWVPYPIAKSKWPALARSAGLVNPRVTASVPSIYQGDLYAGVADRA
jgi:SAM-dependent methyltransferase